MWKIHVHIWQVSPQLIFGFREGVAIPVKGECEIKGFDDEEKRRKYM